MSLPTGSPLCSQPFVSSYRSLPESYSSIETSLAHLPGAGVEWQNQTVPQKYAGGLVLDAMAGRILGG